MSERKRTLGLYAPPVCTPSGIETISITDLLGFLSPHAGLEANSQIRYTWYWIYNIASLLAAGPQSPWPHMASSRPFG